MKLDTNCSRCGLRAIAQSVCAGPVGPNPVDPKIVFVTGTPGWDREPRALLQLACEEYGIKDFAITSVVKCRVTTERKVYVKEMRACSGYLAHQLATWKPKVVVALGNVALQALTGMTGITKVAGRLMEDGPYTILPMFHPSAIVRDERKMGEFETGFQTLASFVKGETSVVQYDHLRKAEALARLRSMAMRGDAPPYAIDLETTSLNPRFGQIRTFAICEEDGEAWWAVWDPDFRAPMRRLLQSGRTMRAQGAVFEVKWLLANCFAYASDTYFTDWRTVRWDIEDSLLYHHLIHEDPPHRLSVLAKLHTAIGGYDDEMEMFKAVNPDAYKTVPLSVLGNYNAGDADACFRLCDTFLEKIRAHDAKYGEPTLEGLYEEHTEPCIWTVAHCELFGRKFDREAAGLLHAELLQEEAEGMRVMLADPAVVSYQKRRANLRKEWVAERERLCALRDSVKGEAKAPHRQAIKDWDAAEEKRLSAWGDYPEGTFNPNSHLQLVDLLFGRLRTPVRETTDGGSPSAAEKHLTPVQDHHPLIPVYLTWKKANTIRQRYLEKRLLPFLESDGFIYGSYMLHGTQTGRWASKDPNLQNVTPRLKALFVSRFVNGQILEADSSQQELRLVAWASECTPLLEAFANGDDVHQKTADGICQEKFGRDAVGKDERKKFGKTPNFGLTYCAGPKQFSVISGLEIEEAKEIRELWLDLYAPIPKYMRKMQRVVERTGKIRGYLGRMRRLHDYDHKDRGRQIHALLAGSNFPIQNLAAELNAWAFARASAEVAREGMQSVPLGATHDSMTFDCPTDEVEQVGSICQYWMSEAIAIRFPWLTIAMKGDVEAGPSWGSMEPLTPETV